LRVPVLGPLEERSHRRRAALGLPGGLGQELADDRAPAGDVPERVPVPRLVLARHRPEVVADGLGVREPVRVVNERGHRLGGSGPDTGDGPQQADGRGPPGLAVQLWLDPAHLEGERLNLLERQVAPELLRERRRLQSAEPLEAGLGSPPGVLRRGHARSSQQRPEGVLGPRPLGNELCPWCPTRAVTKV
jgi:hypothetical protein